jgi:hypothetical protein
MANEQQTKQQMSEEQFQFVIARTERIFKEEKGLSQEVIEDIEIDALALCWEGDNTRLSYCQTIWRLFNSGLYGLN